MMSSPLPTCLFVNNSPQPGRGQLAKLGGGGMSLLGLLSALPSMGWRAHVMVPGEGQFTDAVRELGIPLEVYPFEPVSVSQPAQSLKGTLHWYKMLRWVRPQVIHANGFDLSRSFAVAAGLAKVPYITHVRFPMEESGARWALRGLPRPAAFVFNSQAMHDQLWPFLSRLAPKTRAYTVHNAVDLDAFPPAPWPESETLRVGLVANFAPIKRHEDFLRMAAEMLQTRTDLEFWIVGDDTEGTDRRSELERFAGELGIMPHVRFMGHRPDIPSIMRQLHLLVVPSQFESFGRVVIEAMACGRPVIASRVGGIPEIIEDGKSGFLLPVGDASGFARAALSLLSDRRNWETISEHAVTVARTRFSLAAHVENITTIYNQILAARRD